ncbi:TlpA disulfide reductase family protein [Chitinophaga caseinilytica]|uniref:TlpA disulfide reductase family protein n=1 Tax=Chitinophaga caseinilytica TaxID=2267521 RepID=A0ABZ2YZM4_9BACT
MQKLLPVLILAGFTSSAAAQHQIIIKGTVKGDLKGYNKVYVLESGIRKDSVEVKNGRFTIRIPWVKDTVPTLQAEHDTRLKPPSPAFPVVADRPGTVNIEVTDPAKGFRSGKISGSKSAVAYQAFEQGREKQRLEIKAEMDKRFENKPKHDSAYNVEFLALMMQRLIPYIGDFVEANADAYIGAYILGRYQPIIPEQDLQQFYDKLSPLQKRTRPAMDVQARLTGYKRALPGQDVVDFTLNSPEDQPVAFSSYRGKYVLIDFWSSWCGPCKASFPHMKELYQKYKGEQFEILGISIDEKKTAWLNELQKQQLPWPQLLDTKNVSVNSFAVTAVPTGFLISPEGKIIMKQVGFGENGDGEIEKKLKELFGR